MMEKKKEGCAEQIVALVVAVIFAPITWTLWGVATSKLWGWFVVPQFKVAALSVPYAIGISLVLSQFKRHTPSDKSKTTVEVVAESIVVGFFGPLIALGTGYVVHRWFV